MLQQFVLCCTQLVFVIYQWNFRFFDLNPARGVRVVDSWELIVDSVASGLLPNGNNSACNTLHSQLSTLHYYSALTGLWCFIFVT
jgi:hypothetical protein